MKQLRSSRRVGDDPLQGRPPKRPNRHNSASHVAHSISPDVFSATGHGCLIKILAACDLESMRLISQTQGCWRGLLRPSTGGADFAELWEVHTNRADLGPSLRRITRESEPVARLCKLSLSAATSPLGRACALQRSVHTSDADLVQSYRRVQVQVHPDCLMHADAEAAIHKLTCALLSTLIRTTMTISEQQGRTLCYSKDVVIIDELPTVWHTPGCVTEVLLHAAIRLVLPGELTNPRLLYSSPQTHTAHLCSSRTTDFTTRTHNHPTHPTHSSHLRLTQLNSHKELISLTQLLSVCHTMLYPSLVGLYQSTHLLECFLSIQIVEHQVSRGSMQCRKRRKPSCCTALAHNIQSNTSACGTQHFGLISPRSRLCVG